MEFGDHGGWMDGKDFKVLKGALEERPLKYERPRMRPTLASRVLSPTPTSIFYSANN